MKILRKSLLEVLIMTLSNRKFIQNHQYAGILGKRFVNNYLIKR